MQNQKKKKIKHKSTTFNWEKRIEATTFKTQCFHDHNLNDLITFCKEGKK